MEVILRTSRCQWFGFRIGTYRPQVQTDNVSRVIVNGVSEAPVVITKIRWYNRCGSLIDRSIGIWISEHHWGHEPYTCMQLFHFHLDVDNNPDGTITHTYTFINASRYKKRSNRDLYTTDEVSFESFDSIAPLLQSY